MQKNRLREIREQRGMLMSDLEEATGVKAATISLQENHKRAIPVETAVIYCDFFNVSLDFLFCRHLLHLLFSCCGWLVAFRDFNIA